MDARRKRCAGASHLDFFREFARCEYCLKAIGIRKAGRNAVADWTELATQLFGIFETRDSPELVTAVEYFLEHPPKKQVVEDGALAWDDSLPDHASQGELLLLLVCRVRNNLFHGGKFNGRWFEPERSEQLLKHGLTILATCLDRHETMKEAYEQKAM